MSGFDRVCAVPAFLLGALFVVLGIFGLFAGCSAHFTLPPVLGVIPAFAGWGIVRAVYIAWQAPRPLDPLGPDEDEPTLTEHGPYS